MAFDNQIIPGQGSQLSVEDVLIQDPNLVSVGNVAFSAVGSDISATVDLSGYQLMSEKGIAGGYASLDGGGKVPITQLPSSIMQYQGTWNANTNTPTLVDGTGSTGDVYRVTVAGSQNLGSGSISFDVGDYVIYNNSGVWEKSDTTDAVATVNGYTGNVTLDIDDIVVNTLTSGYLPYYNGTDLADSVISQSGTVASLDAEADFKLPNAPSFGTTGAILMGTYGSISEAGGGLAYIQGNAIKAQQGASNTLIKIASDPAQYIAMRYDRGVYVGTNLTGVSGTTFSDYDNLRFQIDLNGNVSIGRALNTASAKLDVNGDTVISGNVGIGTTSPSRPLDVIAASGGLAANFEAPTGGNTNGVVRIATQDSLGAYIRFENLTDGWLFGLLSTEDFTIRDPNTNNDLIVVEHGGPDNQLYLDSSGNVGIGTASPGSLLDVAGTITGDGLTIAGDGNLTGDLTVTGGKIEAQGADDEYYLNFGGTVNVTAASGVTYQAIRAVPSVDVTTNLTNLYALNCNLRPGGTSSNSVTNLYNFNAQVLFDDTYSGAITNYYAYRVSDASLIGSGTPTITNMHGMMVNDLSYGTNNYAYRSLMSSGAGKWGLFLQGTANNYINGNVWIGTSSSNHKLDVQGNIGLSASSYLNWGTTTGSTGYGIRDNSGAIEVKNSGGSWIPVATTTGTQTLTNKTLSYTKAYSAFQALGNLGTTETINWSNTKHSGTLDSNVTISFSNATNGQSIEIWLAYDGTAQRTITWPTMKWLGGTAPDAPSAAGEILVVTISYDGTNYIGSTSIAS